MGRDAQCRRRQVQVRRHPAMDVPSRLFVRQTGGTTDSRSESVDHSIGVMNLDTIVTSLLSAAAILKDPIQGAVSESLKDAYGAAKAYLSRKCGEKSPASEALEQATKQP